MASGNGRPTTTVGALSSLSEKLVNALPPTLLFLVLLNIVILGVASWVFSQNTTARNDMLTKIIDTCLVKPSR